MKKLQVVYGFGENCHYAMTGMQSKLNNLNELDDLEIITINNWDNGTFSYFAIYFKSATDYKDLYAKR